MSFQVVTTGAVFVFIVGALLLATYGLAMPIRDLLLSARQHGKPYKESRAPGGVPAQITDGKWFAEWRRKIGLVGAALCMTASLLLTLASFVPSD